MPFKLIYNLVNSVVIIAPTPCPLTNQLKSYLSISLFDFHLYLKRFMSTSIFLETVRKNLIKAFGVLARLAFLPWVSKHPWLTIYHV